MIPSRKSLGPMLLAGVASLVGGSRYAGKRRPPPSHPKCAGCFAVGKDTDLQVHGERAYCPRCARVYRKGPEGWA
jgi:uncharacterized paraquat-inducible protein A